jgi:hypothetical protein
MLYNYYYTKRQELGTTLVGLEENEFGGRKAGQAVETVAGRFSGPGEYGGGQARSGRGSFVIEPCRERRGGGKEGSRRDTRDLWPPPRPRNSDESLVCSGGAGVRRRRIEGQNWNIIKLQSLGVVDCWRQP